jgi:hypothetical protein
MRQRPVPGATGSWETVWQPLRIVDRDEAVARRAARRKNSATRELAWRLPPAWPRLIANPASHRRFPQVRRRPDAESFLAEQVIRYGQRTDPRQTNLKSFCQRALIGPAGRSSTATGCWKVGASPFLDWPSKGGREADSTAGTCRSYKGFQLQLDRCARPF